VKGRWYAWVVKRFWAQWGPETHGSKFHRHIGSMGCRKPRRVIKGHMHAWHMGTNRVSIKNKRCLDVFSHHSDSYLVIHWSIPWSYNSYVYCSLMA
jgi:large subunit ribosomal protein L3